MFGTSVSAYESCLGIHRKMTSRKNLRCTFRRKRDIRRVELQSSFLPLQPENAGGFAVGGVDNHGGVIRA